MEKEREELDRFISILLDGDVERAIGEAKKLRRQGVSAENILTHGIERAMMELDAKCTVDEFNLLEIMLCGRAAMGVIQELFSLEELSVNTKGVVTLATLEGDVHDLGKNIVKTILMGMGYRVVDCGKNCPLKKLADTAEEQGAFAVGVSGLISTIIPEVRKVREELRRREMEYIPIIAGGAVLKQSNPEKLNVDYLAQNAFDGLHFLGDSNDGE